MQLALVNCVVELILKIAARTKGMPAMVQALATVMGQATLQRGCVDCRLYTETGDPNSLCYLEQWSTLQDLDFQLRSQRFGMLLAIMETAPQAPALEVRTIADQRGLEYVRSIRLASPGMTSTETGCAIGINDLHPKEASRPGSTLRQEQPPNRHI